MSYWADAKIATTKDIIKQLTAFEQEHGVGAVSSIATVCSGVRITQHYFEVKDAHGNNETRIPIPAVRMGELLTSPDYRATAEESVNGTYWNSVSSHPENGAEVLVEYFDNVRKHAVCTWIDGQFKNDDKVIDAQAWKYITASNI